MPLELDRDAIQDCLSCPIGAAVGADAATRCPRCPFRLERACEPGAVLTREGEPAATVWFIRSGGFSLTRSLPRAGVGAAGGVRGPGDFLALEALVHPAHVGTSRALARAAVCGAPVAELDAWLGQRGSPARVVLEQSLLGAFRRRGPTRRSEREDPRQRVARWLLDAPAEVAWDAAGRRAIAERLGLRPITVGKVVGNLSRAGAVALGPASLRVLDRALLAAAAR